MISTLLNHCVADMRAIASQGCWSLQAQIRAYDLLDALSAEVVTQSADMNKGVQTFFREYSELSQTLDAMYDESVLRMQMEDVLRPLRHSLAQAERKVAQLTDLHECAKSTFEIWQSKGLWARCKALRTLRAKAGFRLESKRIGNYVAKTFDLMNEARAGYASAQQALFNADVSYKIKQGLYLQIKTHLESLFPEYDPLAKGEINQA